MTIITPQNKNLKALDYKHDLSFAIVFNKNINGSTLTLAHDSEPNPSGKEFCKALLIAQKPDDYGFKILPWGKFFEDKQDKSKLIKYTNMPKPQDIKIKYRTEPKTRSLEASNFEFNFSESMEGNLKDVDYKHEFGIYLRQEQFGSEYQIINWTIPKKNINKIDQFVTDTAAQAFKTYVDQNGGLESFSKLLEQKISEAKPYSDATPKDLIDLKIGLVELYSKGIEVRNFQKKLPEDAGLRVVWNAVQAEVDTKKYNLMLASQEKRYGIPGGGRPWAGTFIDRRTAPIAKTIVNASHKLNVDPTEFYTVLAGEGAAFYDIDKMDDFRQTWEKFNIRQRDGYRNYGLDNFATVASQLFAKGYLPKDFKFKPVKCENELKEPTVSGIFNSFEDIITASVAVWKHTQDQTKALMHKLVQNGTWNKTPTNPETIFFYTYAVFNVGQGGKGSTRAGAEEMMKRRGPDYIPKWDGTTLEGNSQKNGIRNAVVRCMQRDVLLKTGLFNGV